MVDYQHDILGYINNFAKTVHIPSITIVESKLSSTPKVTIAIPTFKRANLLKEAVDSALGQKGFDDYDIIIVDNNPERGDETEQLMLSYDDSRLSYYKNSENIRMAGNWNRLYMLARGEWVVMLHDDDILFDDYLSFLFNRVLLKAKADALFPAYSSEKERVNKKAKFIKLDIGDFLRGNIIGPPVGFCVKKDCILSIGGFSDELYPSIDYHLYVKLVNRYRMVKIYNYTTAYYRILDNESLKTSTLLEFINKDSVLKSAILGRGQHLRNKLWLVYFKTYNVWYLKMMSSVMHNTEVDLKMKIREYSCSETYLSKLVYFFVEFLNTFLMRLRSVSI